MYCFIDSGFNDLELHDSEHAILQCREDISLLRPLDMIKAWQQEQRKIGFLSLTMDEFGIKNVHGYIKKIKSAPSDLFSAHEENMKAGIVTGRFIRHVTDVRKYRFKNRATGKISTVFSTPNHPFYVKNKGRFIPLEAISSEDKMVQKDGQVVHMISSSPYGNHCGTHYKDSVVSVYNLEVFRKHTYFVGQDFILVHNPYNEEQIIKKESGEMPLLESYKKFKQYNCFGLRDDPCFPGKRVKAFTLKAEDRSGFILDCGYNGSCTEKRMEERTIRIPLKKLGFESVTRQLRKRLFGKKNIVWVLRNRVKFRESLPGINIDDAFSPTSYPPLSFCSQPQPRFLFPIDTSTLPRFDEVGKVWKEAIWLGSLIK